MLGKKRKLLSDSKNDKFLLKLYEILNKEEYNKIIQWSQNGSFIIISNVQANKEYSSNIFQSPELFIFCQTTQYV